MGSAYKDELQDLGVMLSHMGGLAEEQLAKAMEALRRRKPDLAEEVIASDEELDRYEAAVDEATVRILALRQPMAVDLREVVAAIKVASALERIGDMSKSIARRAQIIAAGPPRRMNGAVLRMGKLARQRLGDSLDAMIARDADAALKVWRQDVEIDELYNSLTRDVLDELKQDRDGVDFSLNTLFIAKSLERIGDHATFVSEMAYFIATGQTMPGERPKGAPETQLWFD